MAIDPFLCPICSEVQDLSGKSVITCEGCGSSYEAGQVDPLFPILARLWTPDERNADAYVVRIAETLRSKGLVAHPLPKQSYDLPNGQGIRIVLTQGQKTGSNVLAVATGPWSQELTLQMVNVLMLLSNHLETQGTPPRFSFLADFPLPDPIRFLFATRSPSRFERIAMGQTELWNSQVPVDPASTKGLTTLAATLIDLCFQIPLDGTMADVQPLEDLVLQRFRFPLKENDPLPPGGYIPSASLLMIAMLVGRSVISAAKSPCLWAASPDSHFGLTLSTYMNSIKNRGQANLVDKVFKLWEHGAEDSFAFLARHIVNESTP